MISAQEVESLERIDGGGRPVLSLYLDMDPERQVTRSYRIIFEDLVRPVRHSLDKRSREQLEEEVALVQEFLSDKPRGRGLVLFTCSPIKLMRDIHLAVPVRDHLAFEPSPDTAPLWEFMDEYERYAVAIVEKERARIFTVFMGEIEEETRSRSFVFGKHDQGGISQANYLRHHEAHVDRHLRDVAQRLTEIYRKRPFQRLILGGPEEAVVRLRSLLPKSIVPMLIRTIAVETSATSREILRWTLQIEQELEREEEARRVDRVLDTVAAGGLGTKGVDETLFAIWSDAVNTLLVSEGVRLAGTECSACGRLNTSPGEPRCTNCGGQVQAIHDVFERAIERASEQEAVLDVLHGQPARRLQDEAEGMAALLRFSLPVPVR